VLAKCEIAREIRQCKRSLNHDILLLETIFIFDLKISTRQKSVKIWTKNAFDIAWHKLDFTRPISRHDFALS